MPRYAANLSMLYPELPFLDRFEAAARDGFRGVEFLFPYEHAPHVLRERLAAHGLQQVLFNAPPGDWAAGERGTAGLPGREAEFRSGFEEALAYAEALDCPRIHVMAGLRQPGVEPERQQALYEEHLDWAASRAASAGRRVLVEPLNPRDMPGYLLSRQDAAHALVQRIGASNLQVQMDLYHCQIVEGDLTTKLRALLPTGRVGHLQIAGVPDRHEPDLGEIDGRWLMRVVDEVSAACGWDGWVGCEYRPARGAVAGGTTAGLGWLRA